MSTSQKILLFIFVILLLITMGEIGWYFYSDISANKTEIVKENIKTNNSEKLMNICKIIDSEKEKNPTAAVHPDVIEMFKKYEYDKNVDVVINVKTKAKIIQINNKTDQAGYRFGLEIQTSRKFWLYFPDFSLQRVHVYNKKNNKELKLSDLKINDRIEINEIYNPYYAPTEQKQLVSLNIYKL